MEEYKFKKEEVRANILSNKHNHITTSYYLSLKKKIRKGGISVADLNSKLFLKYLEKAESLLSYFNKDIQLVIEEKNKTRTSDNDLNCNNNKSYNFDSNKYSPQYSTEQLNKELAHYSTKPSLKLKNNSISKDNSKKNSTKENKFRLESTNKTDNSLIDKPYISKENSEENINKTLLTNSELTDDKSNLEYSLILNKLNKEIANINKVKETKVISEKTTKKSKIPIFKKIKNVNDYNTLNTMRDVTNRTKIKSKNYNKFFNTSMSFEQSIDIRNNTFDNGKNKSNDNSREKYSIKEKSTTPIKLNLNLYK